jgi:RNA polymerase sigma factor (sigma-70 family)
MSDTEIKSHFSFVTYIARKYYKYCNSYIQKKDLIQEGTIGLLRANKRFRQEKECSFLTYAGILIKGHIINYLKYKRLVLVNYEIKKRSTKLKNFEKYFIEKYNRVPTDEEIEKNARIKKTHISSVREIDHRYYSLSTWIPNYLRKTHTNSVLKEELYFEDILEDEEFDIEGEIYKKDIKNILDKVIKNVYRFKDRDLFIIEKRLKSDNPLTLEKIGEIFNVTRERVRQIEGRILRILRNRIIEEAPELLEDIDEAKRFLN